VELGMTAEQSKRPSTLAAQSAADAVNLKFRDSARWRAILDSAATMFASRGYEATSIQDVAGLAGITKGSLYHYIGGKDDLLFHVLMEIHDIHLDHFERYSETPGGPLERLRAFIEGHVEVNIADIDRGSIFYLNFESLPLGRRELILEKRRHFDRFVRQVLQEAKSEGVVRQDLNVEIAALGILTALNSMYLWWDPSRSGAVDVPRQFADLFIAGVLDRGAELLA